MDGRKNRVFIALGSNLGERKLNLSNAIDQLVLRLGEIQAISSVYETAGWGNADLLPFYNQVVVFSTILTPAELLEICQEIETKLGRERSEKSETYQNRIIDLDILFYEDQIIGHSDLQIPHPHISDRKFVLVPLNEVDSEFEHPLLKKPISFLLHSCKDPNDVRIAGS